MNHGKEFRNFAVNHLNISGNTTDQVINHLVENSMTPYILEERALNVTQMDIFSRLLRDRLLWLAGPVNDNMSTVVQAQLMFLDTLNQNDITLHCDTPGGSVKSGLSIVDVMNYIKSDVATVNTGMCASMGSVLLSSGTKGKRSSLIHSKVMTHMVSHGSQGNIQETRITQIEAEKYNFILFKMLAENCGKTFQEMLESSRNDKWFNSQQALEFGLVDEIIGVDKNKSIDKYMEGFDEYYDKEVLKK
jgi:ATP-dependent Clp protease protease subunit